MDASKAQMTQFIDFTEGITLHDNEFKAYKQSIGSTPFELRDKAKTTQVVREIMTVCEEVSAPFQGYLHCSPEFFALYEVVFGLHDNGIQPSGHIVNCGTYRGANACIMAMALRNAGKETPLITIDPFMYAAKHTFITCPHVETTDTVFLGHKQLIEKLGLQSQIVSIFHKDLEYLNHFWNFPIQIAAIDTMHSYEHTQKEIAVLTTHIVPGGWFVSHDYMPEFPGVVRAIHEFLDSTTRRYKLYDAWAYLFIHFLD